MRHMASLLARIFGSQPYVAFGFYLWLVDRPAANDLHPTMKPVALVERAIRNSSKSRDTILDAFAGAGSTLIACEATGRYGRLVELDPRYCDAGVRRWQDHTGGEVLRARDGLTYAQAAEATIGVGTA